MTDGEQDDRFRRLLDQHLKMNPKTWAALAARGVNDKTLLVIDFAYTAPGEDAAEQLVATLRERTNFACEARAEDAPHGRVWRVAGHTQPSNASLEMLNDWVTFMVTTGARHGRCRFDGWGVAVAEPPAS